jgi:hypothetical protein
MDRVYKNCGVASCDHKGSEHLHPFLNEGDAKSFPINSDVTEEEAQSKWVSNRNTNFSTGNKEAKIIPFKPRNK